MTNIIELKHADRVIQARPTQDGDGVNIRRIAGQQLNPLLDPFLLIDEIRSDEASDYVGGFPPHPHRGFQTLTYMIEGGFKHKDSMGNEGVINDGGLQWMSAASGVIHSEMPIMDTKPEARMHGYQIWLNLPAADKMRTPAYRDLQGDDVPEHVFLDGSRIRALVGQAQANSVLHKAALQLPESHAQLFDVSISESSAMDWILEPGYQYQIYLIEGQSGGLSTGHLANFEPAPEARTLRLEANQGAARYLVLGGVPIREAIAQYGPFVMNTMDEIEQAMRDYRDDRLVQKHPETQGA